jgi:hypothetical protein
LLRGGSLSSGLFRKFSEIFEKKLKVYRKYADNKMSERSFPLFPRGVYSGCIAVILTVSAVRKRT